MKSEKHPTWLRRRLGKNRVMWVAFDDKLDAPDKHEIARGYAPSLHEADVAASAGRTMNILDGQLHLPELVRR